jgi:hypothetical protein
MARQSKGQRETMERVLHEYKRGELKSGRGARVKSRRQAVAIALNEAGSSRYQSRKKNRSNLRRTKGKERSGHTYMQEREGEGSMRRVRRKVARRNPGTRLRHAAAKRAAIARWSRAKKRRKSTECGARR